MNNRPRCPAREQGKIVGCRFCVWQAGGPSDLCIKMLQQPRPESHFDTTVPFTDLGGPLDPPLKFNEVKI